MPGPDDTDFTDGLVSACRTTVGDSLRSVVYFTPDDFDLLYVRSDLYHDDEARAREMKGEFVENERLGFTERETYNKMSLEPGTEPELGEYEFTIRVFSDGFVSRIIAGDHGVIITTDGMDLTSFEELAVAVRKMLELE